LRELELDILIPQHSDHTQPARSFLLFDERLWCFIRLRHPRLQPNLFSLLELKLTADLVDVAGTSAEEPNEEELRANWHTGSNAGHAEFWHAAQSNPAAQQLAPQATPPISIGDHTFLIPMEFSVPSSEITEMECQLTLSMLVNSPAAKLSASVAASVSEAEGRSRPYQGPLTLLPLRRVLKKLVPVRSGVRVSLHAASVGDEQDSVFLCVDVQNPLPHPIDVESINLEVQGGHAVLVIPPDMHQKYFLQPPITLKPDERVMWTYAVQFYDPLLDSKSAYKPAFQPPFPLAESVNSLAMSLKYRHPLNSKSAPIESRWYCQLGAPGELVLVSSPRDITASTAKTNTVSEGIAITISGPAHVSMYRVFTLSVVVSNRSSTPKRIMLQLPLKSHRHVQISGLVPRPNNLQIGMTPQEFLQSYDGQNALQSAFITLENNVRLDLIQPKTSVSVRLHFVPVQGAGSLQRIKSIQVVDLDLDETVTLTDAFEVLVRAPQ
jgi:hypothetical protein